MADQQSNDRVPKDLNSEALEGLYPDDGIAEEIQRLDAELTRAFYNTFTGADGERVLRYFEENYGGLSFANGNPELTNFNEGQRSVLLAIKDFINRATKGE